MKTPWDFFQSSRTKIKNTWKIAFLSAFVLGILIHLPVMLSDIPNHDGLSSMYFDQNMITSGRWFLSVACGFSSYFTIPWIIGLIGLLWLALAADCVLTGALLRQYRDTEMLTLPAVLAQARASSQSSTSR